MIFDEADLRTEDEAWRVAQSYPDDTTGCQIKRGKAFDTVSIGNKD
ncbi:hypothetical protein ACVOMV_08070 [Mesorhizobium atlanticum]